MTMFLAPYTAIADIDGSPLDAGFLYLGEYGKDPVSFPVEVFWDMGFTIPASQPIRTRNGYPVRNGSPAKVYLKTAQHSIAIKNKKGSFVLVDFYNKGWDASFIVDASGKNQQEINDNIGGVIKTLSDLGAVNNPSFDSSAAWLRVNTELNDGDTLIVDTDNFISSFVSITKDINIDCRATIYLDAAVNNARLDFTTPFDRTILGTELLSLPKKGDSKLSFISLDFDLTDYFFVLESTEIATTRPGYPTGYFKNEVNEFVTADGILRGPILHDHTNAAALQIKLIKKGRSNSIDNLKVRLFNAVGATRKDTFVEFRREYAKTITGLDISKEGAEHIIGASVKFTDCLGFTCVAPRVAKSNAPSSESSYPFFNVRSGFMLFMNPMYVDGSNIARKENGYGGRHGRNIVFIMPQFGGLGDHWGHDYIVEKAVFTTQGVNMAGGSLTLRDCSSFGVPLVALRGDNPYADGTLTLDNCYSDNALIYSSHVSVAGEPTIYKHWDLVRIINTKPCSNRATNGAPLVFINSVDAYGVNTILKTDVEIDGLVYTNISGSANSSVVRFQRGQPWLRKLKLRNIEDKTAASSGFKYMPLLNIECESLDIKDFENLAWRNITTNKLSITGGSIGNGSDDVMNAKINASAKFSTEFTSKMMGALRLDDSASAKLYFTHCDFDTLNVFANTSVTNRIESMSGNSVGGSISAFNCPFDIYHYAKPASQKQRYATTVFVGQTIASNSATESYSVTVQGARVGDVVDCAPSDTLAGCDVIANVISGNTIRYQINNGSKYTASVPTQTLTFKVRSI